MFDCALVDAKMMAHRQYSIHHVKNKLSTTTINGEKIYTGMLYGTLESIILMQKKYEPKKIIFCHEGSPKHRLKLNPNYKAHRSKDEIPFFDEQFKLTTGVLSFLGIMQVKADDYEADDLIATFVERTEGKKLIVSSDKDLYCLIDPNTSILIHMPKQQLFTVEDFRAKFQFSPKWFDMYIAMVGDKSDGISGLPKIGPSRTKAILTKCVKKKDVLEYIPQHLISLFLYNMRLIRLVKDIKTSQMIQLGNHNNITRFWGLMEQLKFRSMSLERNRKYIEAIYESNKSN